MAHKAVFLDRDGIVTKDVHYCRCPEDLELLPRVPQAIKLLNEHCYKVVILTNQSGVGRGYFNEKTLAEIHEKMKDELAKEGAVVDAIYYCPHHPDDNCSCRKPKPQLVFRAVQEHNLELQGAFMVGDRPIDIELGRQAGCRTILVRSSPSKYVKQKPDFFAPDLTAAVDIMLALDQKEDNEQR